VEYKKLYAVNANNGQLRWSYMLPSQIHLNSLFLDGQTLYLSSADDPNTSSGSTCVIGLADGHLLKCYPLQALAIHKGIIYGFSGSDDLTGRINLYAFSMENNQQLWQEQIPIPHEIFEQLVYNDGVLYTTSEIINKNYRLPSTDSYVSAFDAQTGHFLWQSSQKANDVITSLPTVGNGEVYYSSQDGYSYAINATNGQFLWKILISHEVTVENYSSSADGWLYMGVVSYSGYPHITYLTELNAASGKQIWKYSLLNYAGDRLFLLNGLIYTSTNDGKVHALKASDGSPVWETNVDKSFTGLFMKTSMIIAP
jgi:outer membrane protein assembly factor BamB